MATANKPKNDFTFIIIYVLGFITGIIFFLISGKDVRKKRHSIQAIILGIIGFILGYVPFIGGIIFLLVWLYGLWIGYQASIGTDTDIPYIAGFAKQYSK